MKKIKAKHRRAKRSVIKPLNDSIVDAAPGGTADDVLDGQTPEQFIERTFTMLENKNFKDQLGATPDVMSEEACTAYLDKLDAPSVAQAKRESIQIADLRRTTTNGAVLFYPACFLDWSIIKDLSDKCGTFIYSDWHTTIPQMEQAMRQMPITNPALNALRCDWPRAIAIQPHRLVPRSLLARPTFLRTGERERYRGNFESFANKKPWCRRVPAIHTVDGQDRKLDLIYLTVEGVSTYWKLFNRRRIAPKYICIKNCGDGFGFNYTPFYHWDQPLGRAVLEGWRTHGHAPEFLITDRADHDWPWTEVVGRVTGAMIYALPKGFTVQGAGQAHAKFVTRKK